MIFRRYSQNLILTFARSRRGVSGGVGSLYVMFMLKVIVRGGFGKHASSIKDTAAVQLPWQSSMVEMTPPLTTPGKEQNFSGMENSA